MKLQSLTDVYKLELQDLYDAENQILEGLPVAIQMASDRKLQKGLEMHEKETAEQIKRLQEVADMYGIELKGKPCHGMKGLIKEAQEVIGMEGSDAAKDAALIAALQRVEHYEIAGYGCAITYAEMLGYDDAVEILKQTLAEEEKADQKLSDIAKSDVNEKALYTNGHAAVAM